MRIGKLADKVGISAKTVRYYESVGLMTEPERTASGYRDYDVDAVERLRFVRDAKSTGLTLSEILSVLELKTAGEQSCGHSRELLKQHVKEIDEQLKSLRNTRKALLALSKRAKELDPSSCTDPNRCQVISSAD